MSFEFLNHKTSYTGPLSVTSYHGTTEQQKIGSGHETIILLGNAIDCADRSKIVSARMEMTPEEAIDLAKSILNLAQPILNKKQ